MSPKDLAALKFQKAYNWDVDCGKFPSTTAESASMPSYQLQHYVVAIRGARALQAGPGAPGSIQLNFAVEDSGSPFRELLEWQKECYDPSDGCIQNAFATVTITLKGDCGGGGGMSFTLHNCLIQGVSGSGLQSDPSSGNLSVSANIMFQYFESS